MKQHARALAGSLLSLTLSVTLAPGVSRAAPVLAPSALPTEARRALEGQVRAARAQDPALFVRVGELQGLRPAVYRTTRLQRPAVTRELMELGPAALLPMLELLALRDYPRALAPNERDALELGLLEAVGALHDRRAEPVLRAAFVAPGTSADAALAAARGLGALCGDAEIALLTARAATADARGLAALEGLGRCRRPAAVRPLASALDRATDDATIAAAARGLGSAGSRWAQEAAGGSDEAPALAAAALVRAFVRATGEARGEVRMALLAVGYAGTPPLLDAARASADAPTRAALDELQGVLRLGLAR